MEAIPIDWIRQQADQYPGMESCRRVIKLQKKLLESEDNVQKKMFEYADLVKKSFDISCKHTDHVVEGLNKLIEAVREEEADDA